MISKMGKEKGSGRSANSSGASNLIFNYIILNSPQCDTDEAATVVVVMSIMVIRIAV